VTKNHLIVTFHRVCARFPRTLELNADDLEEVVKLRLDQFDDGKPKDAPAVRVGIGVLGVVSAGGLLLVPERRRGALEDVLVFVLRLAQVARRRVRRVVVHVLRIFTQLRLNSHK